MGVERYWVAMIDEEGIVYDEGMFSKYEDALEKMEGLKEMAAEDYKRAPLNGPLHVILLGPYKTAEMVLPEQLVTWDETEYE